MGNLYIDCHKCMHQAVNQGDMPCSDCVACDKFIGDITVTVDCNRVQAPEHGNQGAYVDYGMARAAFYETNRRAPYPMEIKAVNQLLFAVGYIASPKAMVTLWEEAPCAFIPRG